MTFMEIIRLPVRVGTEDEATIEIRLPRNATQQEIARVKAVLDAWSWEPATPERGETK